MAENSLMILIETISMVSIIGVSIIKIGGITIVKMPMMVVGIALILAFITGVLVGTQVPGKATGQPMQNTLNTTSHDDISNDVIQCYGIKENNTSVTAQKNSLFMIILEENPTTGYQWNVSHTDGLNITADSYIPSNPGLPGAGGVHVWSVKATGDGDQAFNAAYERTWENTTTGNYLLNVQVLNPDENPASSAP
jgi:predicted secreted protein